MPDRNALQKIGKLALASRMKILNERLFKDASRVYHAVGIDFEPQWFPVFYLLNQEKQALPITGIARELGLSHPAVIKLTRSMTHAGLLESFEDPEDRRKHLVRISQEGQKLVPELERIWEIFEKAIENLFEETGHDLIAVIERTEQALNRLEMADRIEEQKKK